MNSSVAIIAPIALLAVMTIAASIVSIRVGCRLASGFWPTWPAVFKAFFWCFLAYVPAALIAGSPPVARSAFAGPTVAVVLLVFCAWILGAKLKHPESGPIGTGRGAIVSLTAAFGSFVAVVIAGTIIAMMVPEVDRVVRTGPTFDGNYAECLLVELPAVQNDIAANAVVQTCLQRYPGGMGAVKQGAWAGKGSYQSSAECTAVVAADTPSQHGAAMINAACRKLYDEDGPWMEFR